MHSFNLKYIKALTAVTCQASHYMELNLFFADELKTTKSKFMETVNGTLKTV